MKDKHPIDDFFKSALSEHETKPGVEVWTKIETEVGGSSSRGFGWYFIRAAVIVLMISVGTWVVVMPDQRTENIAVNPVLEGSAVDDYNKDTKGNKEQTKDPKEKKNEKTEQQKKRERVMPIMRNRTNTQPIYVSNDAIPVLEDEESLWYDAEESLATVELNPERIEQYGKPKVKIRMNITRPVTEDSFYAESDSTGQGSNGFRDKLYAYANDQWDNILEGRPVELPKTGKPRLQINLDKLLNN